MPASWWDVGQPPSCSRSDRPVRRRSLPVVFTPDSRVVIFATTVTLGTALLFGLAPALRTIAMGRRVSLSTTQRIAVGQMESGGMRALVVGQLALSVVVVFAAVVLGRTLLNVLRIDPGFPTDRLVVASSIRSPADIRASDAGAESTTARRRARVPACQVGSHIDVRPADRLFLFEPLQGGRRGTGRPASTELDQPNHF